MKLIITEAQLNAIYEICEDVSAMIGCAEEDENGNSWDKEMQRRIRLINTFLKKNGYPNTNNHE